jgi:hypothetical protein
VTYNLDRSGFKGTARTLSACTLLMAALSGCGAEAGAHELGEQTDDLFVRTAGLWPDARIQVCWDAQSMDPKYETARWWIQDAVYATWSAVSSVRFRGWQECTESEATGTGIRVVIFDGVGGQSHTGRRSAGQTRTSIGDCKGNGSPEACVRTLATHEFGHALGFAHEHDRTDATSSCATPKTDGSGYEEYGENEDINAVLNYCNPLWNGGGRLSHTDIRGARHYYGGDGWALESNLFDPAFYLSLYPDLRNAFGSDEEEAKIHWLSMGLPVEGRRGNRSFDVRYYLGRERDVSDAIGFVSQHRFTEGANHWRSFGIGEGRRGSREFDPQYYRNAYSDLNAAFGSSWGAYREHYEWFGAQLEGRRASADFDVRYYLANNSDLSAAFGATNYNAALVHWLQFGIREGRRGAP